MTKNKILNWLVLAILAIYVISPADLLPGPVDDILAILLYLVSNKNSFKIGKKNDEIEVIDVEGREI